jgi:hypothetical protein
MLSWLYILLYLDFTITSVTHSWPFVLLATTSYRTLKHGDLIHHCLIHPPEMLPSAERIVFPNSSFFAQNGASASLPSPSAVRAAGANVPGGSEYPRVRPLAVPFDSMNVMVKYGREITISEGQCLWAIRNKLGHRLPVPEVYGWCRDGNEVFIYMELIRGDTLHSRWAGLSRQEKEDISTQLRQMVGALREFKLGRKGCPVGM